MPDIALWRPRVLDAAVLGLGVLPPAQHRDALAAWLAESLPADRKPEGLEIKGLPDPWRDVLAWAGVPLAIGGSLHWGQDLLPGDVDLPVEQDDALALPDPKRIGRLNALELRPLRLFIAQRLGCRLQSAPGIRMWLWPGRAVLASSWDIPLSGFLYGSAPGHRASIALDPKGVQVVDWPI